MIDFFDLSDSTNAAMSTSLPSETLTTTVASAPTDSSVSPDAGSTSSNSADGSPPSATPSLTSAGFTIVPDGSFLSVAFRFVIIVAPFLSCLCLL